MDGNNRWSKKNDLNKFKGYKAGVENLLKIADYLFNYNKVNYISAFALSKNNLKRPKSLINVLKNILIEFLDNEAKLNSCKKYNIRFIGDRNFLSKEINNKIDYIENIKKNSKKYLIIYLNYSGRQDIIQAAKKFKLSKIKNASFLKFLSTSKFPDPQILIRTGGFNRISDFLIFQLTFTEFFFTKKLWPDFKINDVLRILKKYYLIERKFGR
tara:strand:- start:5779 stop:6417 length:639 start_codon:yes stop_codon:yes gene_type:complete